MNQIIEAPRVPDGIPVTAVMRLKNSHLHEASSKPRTSTGRPA